MKSVYRVLAYLIAACVVLQAAFIALSGFTMIKDMDDGLVFDKNSDLNAGGSLHALLGWNVIPLLALVLLIISFFAKVDGGVKWAGIVFGVTALQVLLAILSFGAPVFAVLHGPNALVLLGVSLMAARKASAAPAPVAAGQASDATA